MKRPAVAVARELEAQKRPKRLRITTDRDAWLRNVRDASALTREHAAAKLEARGKAIAADRRRVWAGRAPELDDVNHGPPGLSAREERTGRVINVGDAVHFEEIHGAPARVVWDPRKQVHSIIKQTKVEAHTERRGGTLPEQARWHFSRARNKRELFERVAECGKAETHKITVVCRDCKHSQEIQVGCGSQWFCPACRKRAMSRLRKSFMRNRLGLITMATRAGLMRRRQAKGQRWGERFLTLTLPDHGSAVERLEVLNATWSRFWRTFRDALRSKLRGRSGIVGASLPNGVPASKFENLYEVKRSFRAAATHRKEAPRLDRLDSEQTGDFELALFDVLSYFRVIEWTPGDVDGQGHPHIHVWLFSQFLEQAWIEKLWREAWIHVQRERLHNAKEPKHGPIDERKTIVHIEASRDGVERELVKYLTKDWDVDGTGKAKRVDPAVFAQVYAYLDGKRRRQSSAAFSMWGVDKYRACECCGFEDERGTWCRVDITHALDHHKERIGKHNPIGWYFDGEHYRPMLLTGATEHDEHWQDEWRSTRAAELRTLEDRRLDAGWLRSSGRGVAALRMAKHLEVSIAWAMTATERRPPLEFERIRFLCEGEPELREAEPDQLDLCL